MPKVIIHILLIVGALLIVNPVSAGEHPDRPPMRPFLNLAGTWKFSIGDQQAWKDANFDDSDWEEIRVPSSWEDQGFHGYNGYAWYRRDFWVNKSDTDNSLMLMLGYIDDADEVYLNGTLIGSSGRFPPYFKTSFSQERLYPIKHDMLRDDGNNVLAIRVYDAHLEGGIVRGDVGIYELINQKEPDLNLAGIWRIRMGDMAAVPESEVFGGKPITVPGYWESQIAPGYNGYAWYQSSFCLKPSLRYEKLVLVLGKIDDTDMVFINGKQIGATGLTWRGPLKRHDDQSWEKVRSYYIPDGVLDPEGNNVIHIRVHDWTGNGGIYQGPVGIVKQERLVNFLRG